MTKTITSVFFTALLASTFYAYAATTPENSDDGSALGTSDTPQVKQQDRRIDKKSSDKNMKKNNRMGNSDKDMQMMKMMDTDNDGMVTHDEYMMHQEKMYGDMNPGEGGVSYKNSMNNKPIGTTTGKSKNGSVDITKDGPINGTTTGTN
jgi:hypothetical protein